MQLAHNGLAENPIPMLMGSPTAIAETFAPYRELGFRTVIVRMPAPFDRETVDRLPEVRAALGG
jgi:hypothetical protein